LFIWPKNSKKKVRIWAQRKEMNCGFWKVHQYYGGREDEAWGMGKGRGVRGNDIGKGLGLY
jgi:hypothetical protein